MQRLIYAVFIVCLLATAEGCGVYTPDKNPFASDRPVNGISSNQGDFENRLVNHIQCELALGLADSSRFKLPWLHNWGTTITQSITVEDQSGISPGISTIQPIASAMIPFAQYASQSIGATGSANALRTETIQYTFRNSDIEKYVKKDRCFDYGDRFFIEGDLKIRQFIFDHAEVAAAGNAGFSATTERNAVFNAFTEEITFVAAYGGSVTPTWKFARFTANTSSNLLIAQRTNTNDLIITLGPLNTAPIAPKGHAAIPAIDAPLQLTDSAMQQHFARVQSSAIAVSVQGQSH